MTPEHRAAERHVEAMIEMAWLDFKELVNWTPFFLFPKSGMWMRKAAWLQNRKEQG